jgi:hypothetical protein
VTMDTKFLGPDDRSNTPYPRHDEIVALLSDRKAPRRMGNAIVVPTDVLLPSHVACMVVIEGGATGNEITASDAGASLACVLEAGLEINLLVTRAASRAAQQYGISLEKGVLRSQPEAISEARYLVMCMANAMHSVAVAALAAARRVEKTRFRVRVQQELNHIFSQQNIRRHSELRGFSQDSHHFDFVIGLPRGMKLALDVPIPESSSIAAVVLRQADIRAARIDGVKQAIAYDKADHWTTSGLAQLQLARVDLISSENLRVGLEAVAAEGWGDNEERL